MTLDWVFRLGQILAQHFLLQTFHRNTTGPGAEYIIGNDDTTVTAFSSQYRLTEPHFLCPMTRLLPFPLSLFYYYTLAKGPEITMTESVLALGSALLCGAFFF